MVCFGLEFQFWSSLQEILDFPMSLYTIGDRTSLNAIISESEDIDLPMPETCVGSYIASPDVLLCRCQEMGQSPNAYHKALSEKKSFRK